MKLNNVFRILCIVTGLLTGTYMFDNPKLFIILSLITIIAIISPVQEHDI